MSDAPVIPFAELKRQARAAKSRHPLAKARQQGRGRSGVSRGADAGMDSPASLNLTQKAPTPSAATPAVTADVVADSYSAAAIPEQIAVDSSQFAANPGTPPSPCLESPKIKHDGHPWGDASEECAVYCRPTNPRILLVTFADGRHGRVICHPKERARFCPADLIWVKPVAGKDLYILAGRYDRRGRRVL